VGLADFYSVLAEGLAANEDDIPRGFFSFPAHFLNPGERISFDFLGEFSVQQRRYSSCPVGFPIV
jgi:hypothetical protein